MIMRALSLKYKNIGNTVLVCVNNIKYDGYSKNKDLLEDNDKKTKV